MEWKSVQVQQHFDQLQTVSMTQWEDQHHVRTPHPDHDEFWVSTLVLTYHIVNKIWLTASGPWTTKCISGQNTHKNLHLFNKPWVLGDSWMPKKFSISISATSGNAPNLSTPTSEFKLLIRQTLFDYEPSIEKILLTFSYTNRNFTGKKKEYTS